MKNKFKTDKKKKSNVEIENFFLKPNTEKSEIEMIMSNRIVFTDHSRGKSEEFVEKFNELERVR